MSTTAREIIERIKSLPAEDQRMVYEEVARLSERQREWNAQRKKLRGMQARHARSGLLNRLLDERTKERAWTRNHSEVLQSGVSPGRLVALEENTRV